MTIREELEAARTREWITVPQIALLTQYDPETIYRWARQGRIPGMVRHGRTVRFVRVVVIEWTRQNAKHISDS